MDVKIKYSDIKKIEFDLVNALKNKRITVKKTRIFRNQVYPITFLIEITLEKSSDKAFVPKEYKGCKVIVK
jgi:hypothetical protein